MSKQDELVWQAAYRNGTMAQLFNWQRASITLDGCMATIHDLADTGERPNSLLLACWAGLTSINTKLEYNGNATRVMARFVDADQLPTYDGLKKLFKQANTKFGCMPAIYAAMVAIHDLHKAGKLPETPRDSWTLEQWQAWRDEMHELPGVGWKVASFIGLLLCPLTCPLVPVDRWVMRWTGQGHGDVPQARARYLAVENLVRQHRDADGHSNLPLGVYHWFKWSQARQAASAETPAERPESHNLLSPRDY